MPNNQSYQFKYNYYGEITKITYPTGAYERFVYGTIDPVQNASPAYNQANRGVTNRFVSAKGDGSDEVAWTYTAGRSGGQYIVTTTAPDSSYTQQYIAHEDDPMVWRPYGFGNETTGRSSEDRVYDSSPSHNLISRKLTDYVITGPLAGGWGGATRDMRPTKEVSIIFEPGNVNALATMTETVYDTTDPVGSSDPAYFSSLNPKQQKSYHYVSVNASTAASSNIGSAVTWFSGATPATLTDMTYLYDVNYKSRNINGLVTQTQILDPANPSVVKARTQIFYDDINGVLPLVELTSTRWEDPNTYKLGLVTKTKTWTDISTNQFIETNAQYDRMGNLRYAWDARGNLTQTVYSSAYDYAYPTSVITPVPDPSGLNGSATSFTTSTAYDFPTGLPTSTVDANNQTTTISYVDPVTLVPDPLMRVRKVTAPNGHQTITEYGAGTSESTRFVKSRSQIDASTWKEGYAFFDGLGRAVKSQSVDPQGDVYSLTCYDNMGRPSQASNPFRNIPNPTCSSSLEWTTNTYDAAGRLWKVTTPDSAVVETLYGLSTSGSEIGSVVTVKDQALKERRSVSNALGQLKRVDEPTTAGLGSISAPNQATSYAYDNLSNLTTVIQGIQTRNFHYDAMSRLTSADNPESGTVAYVYDNGGNLVVRSDARGASTHYAYDALNRLSRRWYNGSESVGATTHNSPGFPLGSGVGTTYEAKYFYDTGTNGKGQLASSKTGYTYLSAWREMTVNEYMDRDIMGRPHLFRQWIGELTASYYDIGYDYNLAGGVTSMTYPSGNTVSYAYDSTGHLSSFQGNLGGTAMTYADTFEYTAFGTTQNERFGTTTPLYHKQQFNSRGQVWDIRLGTSPSLSDGNRGAIVNYYSSNYAPNGGSGPDNNGNLLRQNIELPSTGTTYTQDYTYDSLNRVTSVTENPGSPTIKQTFDYDRYGNRMIIAGQTLNAPAPQFYTSQMADQNRLYSPGENIYWSCSDSARTTRLMCYDWSGNLTRDKHVSDAAWMVYDAENKMWQHSRSNDLSDTLTFFYDADGKRKQVLNAVGKPVQDFVHGLGGELLYDVPYKSKSVSYGYRNGQLLVRAVPANRTGPGDVRWLVTDHLGTPRIIADRTGSLSAVKRHDYLPFGEEIGPGIGGRTTGQGYGSPQSDGVRQQFTGYERDLETGLDFAQARYMGSSLGRFTSPDPLLASGKTTDPQTFNRYTYVINNPTKFVDPDGLCPQPSLSPGQVGICVEAFIAAPKINGIGNGDNRTHDSNSDASARMRVSLVLTATETSINHDVRETVKATSTVSVPGTVTDLVPVPTGESRGDINVSGYSTAEQGSAGFGDGRMTETVLNVGLRNGANGAQVASQSTAATAASAAAESLGGVPAAISKTANALVPKGTIDTQARISITGSGDNIRVAATAEARLFPSVGGYAYIGMSDGSVRTITLFEHRETKPSDLTKPMRRIR
ncbi:MAG: RHS repeat-associated core domain-containing protein [Pyrinomonadaceae bacterium]